MERQQNTRSSFNSSNASLIWFLIVDSATGKPYKQTTASSILRSSLVVPVIDQFRDGVKAKFTNVLSTVNSSSLLLFKNKAAFDKRNAAEDQGKELPLTSSYPVTGLGESEEDAIIVAVASCQQQPGGNGPMPPLLDTECGVPQVWATQRDSLVDYFYNYILYKSYFVFVRSPPMSGKSGMCQLLFKKFSETGISVDMILASQAGNLDFSDYYQKLFGRDFLKCLFSDNIHVILVDEGQYTYADLYLWNTIKNLIDGQFKNLRIVLFSSFGSFDPFRKIAKVSALLEVPFTSKFMLYPCQDKPGLQLSKPEFQEMISGSKFVVAQDLIWHFSSRHIGIARTILRYLDSIFGNNIVPGIDDIKSALYSNNLIGDVMCKRGIPTCANLNRLIESRDLADIVASRIWDIMNRVASGEIVFSNEGTPGTKHAVQLLTQFGFLHESERNILFFASHMHLLCWLYSCRTDPLSHLLVNCRSNNFLSSCIQRMSSSRLLSFEVTGGTRERQIQHELYRAIVSCVPRDVFVIPERESDDQNGYIDICIVNTEIHWLWELLFDGNKTDDHINRFQPGGKYFSSIGRSTFFSLIDFRIHRQVRKMRDGIIYVSFSEDFKYATIISAEGDTHQVALAP